MNASPITSNQLRIAVFILLAAFTLAACQPQSTEPQPPDIAYGQDMCEGCGMIISEARYAAALVMLEGPAHKFDEIAEMVIYNMDHPNEEVRAWFVHDYNTEGWIRGEAAFYVMSADLPTPMGGGVVAFETLEDAEAFAEFHNTTALTFDEMRANVHLTLH